MITGFAKGLWQCLHSSCLNFLLNKMPTEATPAITAAIISRSITFLIVKPRRLIHSLSLYLPLSLPLPILHPGSLPLSFSTCPFYSPFPTHVCLCVCVLCVSVCAHFCLSDKNLGQKVPSVRFLFIKGILLMLAFIQHSISINVTKMTKGIAPPSLASLSLCLRSYEAFFI